MTVDKIVHELAAMEPCAPSEVDSDPYCFFCNAHHPEKLEDHDTDCIWRAARQLGATISGWHPIKNLLLPAKGRFAKYLVHSAKYGTQVATVNGFGDWSSIPTTTDRDDGFYLQRASEAGITAWMPEPTPPGQMKHRPAYPDAEVIWSSTNYESIEDRSTLIALTSAAENSEPTNVPGRPGLWLITAVETDGQLVSVKGVNMAAHSGDVGIDLVKDLGEQEFEWPKRPR